MAGEPAKKKQKQEPSAAPSFPVATWTAGKLNLRAFVSDGGCVEWIFDRVFAHFGTKSEGGRFLKRNLQGLHALCGEMGMPPSEIKYRSASYQPPADQPWLEHTVGSRGVVMVCLFHLQSKATGVESKVKAMELLQTLTRELVKANSGAIPPMQVAIQDASGMRHRVALCFTPHAVTKEWGTLLQHCPIACQVWDKLKEEGWCQQIVTSSLEATTLYDILVFLAYVVAHPKERYEQQTLHQCIALVAMPDVLVWFGRLMDELATTLSQQKLEELPLLKTLKGNLKKSDQVNKFLLFEKLKGHKVARKRIASTHDNLTGQHSEVVATGHNFETLELDGTVELFWFCVSRMLELLVWVARVGGIQLRKGNHT